jgi:hypothetical protein
MIEPRTTATMVKKVNLCPILNQANINRGKFKRKYIIDVDNVNGRYLSLTVLINCAKPVIPDEYICPGVQKKFRATATAIE